MNEQTSKFIESGNKGSSEVLLNTIGTAKEIATLIKYSPSVKANFWEVNDNVESEDQEDLNNSRKDGSSIICSERWMVRGSC